MNPEQLKAYDAETLAYKQFMKVAKRVNNLQYGKWQIVPDIKDPLRKFSLEKEFGWATVKYTLTMEQFYHRADYTENRYGYRAKILVSGLFADTKNNMQPLFANVGMKLRPRMAKKLITITDEVIIPKFIEVITNEQKQRLETTLQIQAFKGQLNKLQGLKLEEKRNYYGNGMEYQGSIKDCPFVLKLESSTVNLQGSISYDQLAEIINKMGWGK